MGYLVQILDGLGLTVGVFLVSLIISLPLGILVSCLRLSKIKTVSKVTEIYIWVLRGTPLLLQIMFVFFGLASIGIKFGRFNSIVFAFALNYSAYFGEIFRSGIQSIEKGQSEAASILGFSSIQINLKIILPQVIKRTLPSIGNEVITLVKDTSLVYAVGQSDILKYAKGIAVRDATLVPYLIAGGVYLVLTYIITKVFESVERKVNYEE
ncbi:MAG TPA: amino acid ABC transporter permease [Lachnospiraceae bacterium]|nr:amino acid ABC transporter permease [Lachnospiraceae bacterium]